MAVSVVICVACLFVGAFAGARWLPDLAPGPVGGLALCVVCGLLGMALAVLGLHVYEVVEVEDAGGFGHLELAGILSSMFADAGPLIGLAIAVYLLAPKSDAPGVSNPPPAPETAA
jgi:hypothetical protein